MLVDDYEVINKIIFNPIGGEGNGGVIYPKTHYGRDALIGIIFFISHLVEKNRTSS